MHKFLALIMGVTFMATSLNAGELTTNAQKRGYALGLIMAQQAEQQMFGPAMKLVDIDAMAAGFVDGAKSKGNSENLKMKDAEIQKVLTELNAEMQAEMAKQAEAAKKQGEANAAAAKAFLEKNKTVDGVKTTASGLQYQVLKAGTGNAPKKGDTVSVHYTGTLLDGKEFDSSVKRNEPFKFTFPGQVIKGWNEALELMKEGDKIKIFLPPELAYGEHGMPPVIPPSSALVFEIELLKVEPAPAAK